MKPYVFTRGETIVLALDALTGDPLSVTGITAKLRLIAPGRTTDFTQHACRRHVHYYGSCRERKHSCRLGPCCTIIRAGSRALWRRCQARNSRRHNHHRHDSHRGP